MLRLQRACTIALLLGCGGAPSSPHGDADSDAAEGTEPADDDDASPSENDDDDGVTAGKTDGASDPAGTDGATSEGETDADPTSSDGDESSSGSGGSEPTYPTPHFPLEVGLQWTYRHTRVDGSIGTACDNRGDEHVTTVTALDEAAGVYTVAEEPYCYFASVDYRIVDEYIDVYNGAWYHQLLLPPELDATWAAGGASGATYVWDEHHDSYSVEAGEFEDCWRRKQQGYDVWQIYCHGVGMVASHYAAWGGDTRAELVDFQR